MLENLNLTVEVANNGLKAVEMIEAGNNYDLVLMDLQMPVMDGFEASKQINKINKNIPIIALSAAVMQEDIVKTSEAEMSAHLAKPIDEYELIRTLLEFIKPKKSNKQVFKKKEEVVPHADSKIEFYGVDVEELKHKIGDKPKVIQRILTDFCEEYQDPQQIFDLSKRETDAFSRALHTLKGVSGNISLAEVYELSKKIYETPELQIKKELTSKLIELLKETVENLRIQLDLCSSKASVKEYKKEYVLEHLQEVSENIKHFRAFTQDKISFLEEILALHVEKKIIKELSSYLLGYKYKKADRMIGNISRQLAD